jgi:putative radical SAM enzyme (TIGR03279 family)
MARGIRIIEVEAGSLAGELELVPGDRVWTINGRRVRDALDFRFLTAGEEELTLEVIKENGEEWQLEVEKDESERWGVQFEPMTPRQCGNDCIFCFIQQNPEGARPSLFVRDEDVRFSFMYGNYSTLTTIAKSEVERVIQQRLSPQYVSVHTTDPELRSYMLGINRRDDVMAKMKHFIDHGIEIHAQVVLCPTINDGAHLLRTIHDLADLHPGVISTAIVPLGITENHKYRDRLVPVTDQYCAEIIDLVTPVQQELKARLGTVFAFLGDEFYIRAGRPVPPRAHYRIVRGHAAEDCTYPQIEDGVGMVRQFSEDHQKRLRQLERRRESGEFDQAKARSIYGTIATGTLFYPVLAQAVTEINERFGTRLRAVPVGNTFFGSGVTVAGLLSGIDFVRAANQFTGRFLMLPPDCYRKHDLKFLDGMTIGELEVQIGWPVRRSWAEVLGLPEAKPKSEFRSMSHDYGSVTSISA